MDRESGRRDRTVHAIHEIIAQYGYPGIFALLMFGIFGLPVPDETLLTLCGFLAQRGELHPLAAFLAAFLGSCSGISVSYLLGRLPAFKLIKKYGHYVHITDEHLDRVRAWFDKMGRWVLVVGYFIPGVRHLSALIAGTSCMPYPTFALFAFTGAFIWVGTFISVGYFFGKEWEQMSGPVHRYIMIGAAVILAGALLWYFLQRRRAKHSSS